MWYIGLEAFDKRSYGEGDTMSGDSREQVQWAGRDTYAGCKIVRRGDGVSVLQTPSGRQELGRFLRVDVPKAKAPEVRTARVGARLTDAEHERAKQKAERAGLTLSDWLREVINAQP